MTSIKNDPRVHRKVIQAPVVEEKKDAEKAAPKATTKRRETKSKGKA